jgi:hypothetical protein
VRPQAHWQRRHDQGLGVGGDGHLHARLAKDLAQLLQLFSRHFFIWGLRRG